MEHVGVEQPHKPNDYNGRCTKILREELSKATLCKLLLEPLSTPGQRQQRWPRGSQGTSVSLTLLGVPSPSKAREELWDPLVPGPS